MILMPPKRSRNYSLSSIGEMEIHGETPYVKSINAKIQLTFLTDTVLKFLVIIQSGVAQPFTEPLSGERVWLHTILRLVQTGSMWMTLV